MSATYTRAQVTRLIAEWYDTPGLHQAEAKADAEAALAKLPGAEREVMDLLRIGYSNGEMATLLHVSPATVTRRVSAGIGHLVERMNGR